MFIHRTKVTNGLTSVDAGEGQGGQTLALHLLLLLDPPLGLQDWVLELGPSIYVAAMTQHTELN